MANYPGSVWSPSAKSAGQTIDASHINDAQDEIVAIESGLTQGTAPLNSSRSTVVALSVTGGSTFGVRPVEPPPHAVKVFLESTVTLGTSAASTVLWTAQEIVLNSSMHSTGTNPERITPQSTGVYRATLYVGFTPNSSGNRYIIIADSSNLQLAAARDGGYAADATILSASVIKRFDQLGGYFKAVVGSDGNASTISLSSGAAAAWFSVEKL